MTLHTLFPLALVCHCCSTSIPLFRSHSTLLRSFSPRHGLRYCSAQASTKATPAPQDDRRARIRARTATLDDYRAEIATQERELAATIEKQSEIDSKLEAAGAKQSEYEKKRDKRKEQLDALRDAEVKAALRRRLARQKELGDRICKLEADIHELKQRMGTWRA